MRNSVGIHRLREQVRVRVALPPPAARRAIRLAAGVTLAEAGAAIDGSGESVRLYEAGLRTPRGERLERYVQLLAALQGEIGQPRRDS